MATPPPPTRSRYCYLIDNYVAVFQDDLARDQALVQDLVKLILAPETLPPASEQLVRDAKCQPSFSRRTDCRQQQPADVW